jgi:hypothetical protein
MLHSIRVVLFLIIGLSVSFAQTISPLTSGATTCSGLSDASAFCNGTAATSLTGTIASARMSGSYTGITGVGTLAAGAVPTSLLTGIISTSQLTGAVLTGAKTSTTTVGALPTCNGAAQGISYVVTDALTPVSLALVSAGGAAVVRVLCNGTIWIVG